MNLERYLDITPEIARAVSENRPVVALESTILSHGMPYPQNLEFAHKVEEIIRAEGAVPATTAILGGKLKVGLTADELERMCKPGDIGKVSRRDVAVYLAQKVLILTNKPAKVKERLSIDLPHPRNVSGSEFIRIRKYVTDQIKWW